MNPFTTNPDPSIADWGELRLIDEIRQGLGDAAPPPPNGNPDREQRKSNEHSESVMESTE